MGELWKCPLSLFTVYLSNVSFCFGLALSGDLSLTSIVVLSVTRTSLAPAVAYGINFLIYDFLVKAFDH